MAKPRRLARLPDAQTLAKFDPKETAVRLAQGDAVIGFAKQMKDWPLLEQAVERKLDEQTAFVAWWRQNVRGPGNSRRSGLIGAPAAERQTGIAQQSVSRWVQRLADRETYKATILGAAYQAVHLTPGDDYAPLMSSASAEWETPGALFDLLNGEFHFTLDVCATRKNAKCPRFFTTRQNGLEQSWAGESCWMNPPYGDVIAAWMAKAAQEATAGTTVVCLVPARTDTAWWWDTARYGEVRFLRGRLQFGQVGTAPFPSAVVVLGIPARVLWWEAWPV